MGSAMNSVGSPTERMALKSGPRHLHSEPKVQLLLSYRSRVDCTIAPKATPGQ
jgi:hypothetical protein